MWSRQLKKVSIYSAMISLLLVNLVYGTAAYAEDYKIGYVNALRVLEQSPQAEQMRAQIEKEFAPRDKSLVADQKKLKEMEDRLSKDAAIMSESERAKLERDIINLRRDMKRTQDEFREDLTFRRNEEIAKIQKDIVEAINVVAKNNGYDLILSEGVIYAGQKVDVTDLVIDNLKGKK